MIRQKFFYVLRICMQREECDHMVFLTMLSKTLWQYLLPVMLCLTALYCGGRNGFAPLRHFCGLLRDTYGSLLRHTDEHQRGIFASALAATMGTGNLVGTALALMTGGAGAVFWMWVSALLGMLLVYAENLLAARYRSGAYRGTLAYLTRGFRSRIPAYVFAFCCCVSALGMGNMVQTSAIAQAGLYFHIPVTWSGGVTALLLCLLFGGGLVRIRKTALRLMPLLCGLYLLGCIAVLCRNAAAIPAIFAEILREAFGFRAAGSGFAAYLFLRAVRVGICRGIFSNEAGLGSSAMFHADADASDETAQGKWAAAEVFADTVICCTMTALVILAEIPASALSAYTNASALLLTAFSGGLGQAAGAFLAVCMMLLAFATLIGWYPCGLAAFRFLTGNQHAAVFSALYILLAFAGAHGNPAWIWLFCDCCNGLMALPNLLGLLSLYGKSSRHLPYTAS